MEPDYYSDNIREAVIDDIPEMAAMAIEFHSKLNGMPMSTSTFIKVAMEMMYSHTSVVLVHVGEDDSLNGGIAGILAQWFLENKTHMAYESWLWVAPDSRGKGVAKGLMVAFEEWAKENGAKKIVMVDFTGDLKPVGRWYKRMGFQPLETRYVKDI